eukprot:GHUV01010072.1.p1 GENE.GHUV01010072.1~~GHUV01010072.1.p1  ORF type:complete len:949 (+),score=263.54 GHUV01010072.1:230-3076(+)
MVVSCLFRSKDICCFNSLSFKQHILQRSSLLVVRSQPSIGVHRTHSSPHRRQEQSSSLLPTCSISRRNCSRDVSVNFAQGGAAAAVLELQEKELPADDHQATPAAAAQVIAAPPPPGVAAPPLAVMRARDGNRVAAHIAYAMSDTAFFFPITPATPMAEAVDQWAAEGRKNLFGNVVQVMEMEGEGGVAAALHGSAQAGGLATSFTCSQGLLLMIPNMYKIAGALLPCVLHVTARTVASDAMSMYCDHQDVMGVRQTGWAMLCSDDAQEAQDLALVAHLATLKARLPFLHFFDGIITSHQIKKVSMLEQEAYRPLLESVQQEIQQHRACGLNPARPSHRGSAQSHEVLMQAWEGTNTFYEATPDIVQQTMNHVAAITGRQHQLFEYYGPPDAERVVVSMGSSCCTLQEAVDYLIARGEKVGLLKVHLFRPWSVKHFLEALPPTVSKLAVLDRTKEGGSVGEPLYLDVVATVAQDMAAGGPVRRVVGGRYGLGGKTFTPEMAVAVFDNLKQEQPRNKFTVGITDDLTYTSLPIGPEVDTLPEGTYQCIFWGMGSDGTVGANKEAIKIIGGADDHTYVQGSFSYDAHKSGSLTLSELRFGQQPIGGSYAIRQADYMAIHLASYLSKFDCLDRLKPGGVLVVNTAWKSAEDMQAALPSKVLRQLAALQPQLYVVDARAVADCVGLGKRINMVMQTVFFQLSGVLPVDKAIPLLKDAIAQTYSKQGAEVVARNHAAVDTALNSVIKVDIPPEWATAEDAPAAEDSAADTPLSEAQQPAARAAAAKLGLSQFVDTVMRPVLQLQGDTLPVSAFKPGNWLPPGTTSVERRTVATNIPHWDPAHCSECNICSFVCPHAAIRPVVATAGELAADDVPVGFETKSLRGLKSGGADAEYTYRVQVSPQDCTGCSLCVSACPEGSLTMAPLAEELTQQAANWKFTRALPDRCDKQGHLL